MPPVKFTQQQIVIMAIGLIVVVGLGALFLLNGQKKTHPFRQLL